MDERDKKLLQNYRLALATIALRSPGGELRIPMAKKDYEAVVELSVTFDGGYLTIKIKKAGQAQ